MNRAILNNLNEESNRRRRRNLRRILERQRREYLAEMSRREPINISSDSEEEEREISREIGQVFAELANIRSRLRNLYEKRENVRIKRAIRLRELSIRRRMRESWLPSLNQVNRNATRVQENILNLVSPPTEDDDRTLEQLEIENGGVLPTGQEILDRLVGKNNISLDDVE